MLKGAAFSDSKALHHGRSTMFLRTSGKKQMGGSLVRVDCADDKGSSMLKAV